MAVEKGFPKPPRLGLKHKPVSKSRVNFDILYLVMTYSSLHGLLAMMQTCHTLQSAGVKLLLDRQLSVSGRRHLRSFCRFMLVDVFRRFTSLRSATLLAGDILPSDTSTIAMLTEVFNHASSLEWLEVDIPSEVLDTHPKLVQALSSLSSLQTLSFCGPTKQAHADLISSMCSPLTEVNLSFVGARPSQGLPHILERFAGSLKVLRVHDISCTRAATSQFPQVHTLEASLEDAQYDVSTWIHSFPNLTKLRIIPGGASLNPNDLDRHRTQNVFTQDSKRWSQVQYLSGYIEDLYVAALTCNVGHLRVALGDTTWAAELAAVLESTHPQRLTVELELDEDNWNEEWLGPLIACALTVKDVKLELVVNPIAALQVDPIITCLLALPVTSHVENLDLAIQLEITYDAIGPNSLGPVVKTLREVDVRGFVQKLAQALGSMHQLRIFIPYNSESAWQFDRQEESGVIVQERLYLETCKWSETDVLICPSHDGDTDS